MAPPNVKIKHITRSPSSSGDTRFPKLDECAHFHYENVELGPIQVQLCNKQADSSKLPCSSSANKENENDPHLCFLVTVVSNSKKWVVRRSYRNFAFLDTQLHRCVYDRKYSLLKELPNLILQEEEDHEEKVKILLSEYLERFSQLAGSLINCGPVLNWFELDNRGNRLIVTDEVAINTPAVAAAYVIVPYSALATDEISFDVGDMISVIDMPPPEESSWWRGKKGFEVGFFPSECVEVIGDKVPHSFKLSSTSTKPVFRRHGKLIAFFRSFLLSRPSRRKLKQSGILKERVFGCDLGEHLLNTGREVPMVLKCCTDFIEEYGIVDGIYRLSGVSSNIQRLRLAFDEDRPLNLGDPATVHDIHSVASLLKMYFRELPNPLLTYQLYDKFVSAVQSNEDVRLLKVRDVVQQLPPPHFRTLQYLLNHLARVASFGEQTGMTPKNIAIVWAPNLLRSRDVENGGVGALHVVGVQAVLTEYLIRFSDLIFDDKVSFSSEQEGLLRARPKSLAISTPTKLLSLEEARARVLSTHLPSTQQKYIEVGGGPDKLPSKYHTIIELPSGKNSLPKLKKSPSGWKSFFSRGWYSGSTRARTPFRSRKASTGSLPHHSAFLPEEPSVEPVTHYSHRKKLRTVKSAESLAHCLKESPDNSHKHDISGGTSRKSSPQFPAESPQSFEISSPFSKSPGLQKHTRSSSHESYFESNGMDVISEPSFEEDEHGLFYYVSERMKMLQSSTSWERDDSASIKSTEPHISSEYLKRGPEKNGRKQKLSVSAENLQAKYPKLNEADICEDMAPQEGDDTLLFEEEVPECDAWCSKEIDFKKADLTLDPFLLYEAVANDRSSDASSDENETDPNDRTVVERYGNAETVLVEVHATQDSSSEEDQCSFVSTVEDELSVQRVFPQEVSPKEDRRSFSNVSKECSMSAKDDTVSPPFEIQQNGKFYFSEEFGIISMTNMDISESPEVESSRTLDKGVLNVKYEMKDGNSPINETFEKLGAEKEPENMPLPVPNEYKEVFSDVKNTEELSANLKEDAISETEHFDTDNTFNIISPPSPVYPPKSLKLNDFHCLRTKLDKLPLHKKKQIVISSPSSPVEEVRKRFELQSTKSTDAPTTEVRFRSTPKDLNPNLIKAFESTESPPEESHIARPCSEIAQKTEHLHTKRCSEPVPKSEISLPSVKQISTKYEIGSSKSPKSAPSTEKLSPKCKSPQPSLFTQLKIRKLQSLKADANVSSQPVDPWSDPILDMQEDYHPITLTSPTAEVEREETETAQESEPLKTDVPTKDTVSFQDCAKELPLQPLRNVPEVVSDVQGVTKYEGKRSPSTHVEQTCTKQDESPQESEAVKRERINRIKEERRAQLREKLKQESFRLEAEEKEKVQTKFRVRKDSAKLWPPPDCEEEAPKDPKRNNRTQTDLKSEDTHKKSVSKSSSRFQKCASQELSTGDYLLLQKQTKKPSQRAYEDSRKWLSMPPTDIRDKVAMFERSKETNDLYRLGPNGKFSQKQNPSALTSSFVR